MLPKGRGILRGGFGKFVQRTPLNVGAFASFEPRTVTRFAADGTAMGGAVTLVHRVAGGLRTPEAHVASLEWDQRFGRRVLLKLAALTRKGSHDFVLSPDPAAGALLMSSTGASQDREVESTVRYIAVTTLDASLVRPWRFGKYRFRAGVRGGVREAGCGEDDRPT